MHYVVFPYDGKAEFGTRASVPIVGTVNGVPIRRALVPLGDGTHYIALPKAVLEAAGAELGTTVRVELRQRTDDSIEIPEELAASFGLEPALGERFNRLNYNTKRKMVEWVDSAKRPETRAKRAADLLERLGQPVFSFGGNTFRT